MAIDTPPASAPSSLTACGGFAEPAEILTRLQPEDIHPARLAGAHAWHPWGLTVAPPHDRHVRLVLDQETKPETAQGILEHLRDRLTAAPWPPHPALETELAGQELHCRDDDACRSTISLERSPDDNDRLHAGVVNRDGWPILSELQALNDRIRHVDPAAPSRTDIADLVSWVEDKMSRTNDPPAVVAPLDELLHTQARCTPEASERLTAVAKAAPAGNSRGAILHYLAERARIAAEQTTRLRRS